MILLDTLIFSSEFKIVRTKIKDIWYVNGTIPVYHYQWSPIPNPGSKHEILLPFYTITHLDNKQIIGDFSKLCVNELYSGTSVAKETYDRKVFEAKNTIYAQLYYLLRILNWYRRNPTYCSGQLVTYLKHVIAEYSEFYNPKIDWSQGK